MPGPILWGPNNTATNLQSKELLSNGVLLSNNGPQNIITYNNFANAATTGWSLGTIGTLTNGLPTGTPTFGSGAAGTLSLSAQQYSQSSTGYCLSLASSAATTVGNMLATQGYSTPDQYQSKVMTFTAYYQAAIGASGGNYSGTSSNSLAFGIWDQSNGQWLQSTGNFGFTQSTGTGFVTGTCQLGAATSSIRLVIYFPTATTGAATFTFTDFYFGPQTAPIGVPASDWVSYTPTFVGLGTPTNVRMMSRRLADSLEIIGDFTAGTVSGSTVQIGLGFQGAANNVFIDPAKISSSFTQVVGDGGQGAAVSIGMYALATGGNNYLQVGFQSVSGAATTPVTGTSFGTGTRFSFYAKVPIVGWSSNVQMSNDTDNRLVALVASKSAGTITSGSALGTWTLVNQDTHGAFNQSTGAYTVPVSGDYDVNFTLQTTTGASNPTVYVNGVIQAQGLSSGTGGSITTLLPSLSAGAVITVSNNSTLTLSTSTAPYLTILSISRRSGPSVIAATESVNMRYFSSSTPVSGSLATVVYSTKGWDSHNAYNSTTGLYTVPVSGKYQINASIAMTGTFILNTTLDLQVQQTGSATQISESKFYAGGAVTQVNTNVGDIFNCNAGDVLKVQVSNTGTTPVIAATTTQNWFSISRVGN